jgi:hypothetical protein
MITGSTAIASVPQMNSAFGHYQEVNVLSMASSGISVREAHGGAKMRIPMINAMAITGRCTIISIM